MRTKRWVLFWPAAEDDITGEVLQPETYIASASSGYFETGRIELAHGFDFPRDAYDWAAKRAELHEWKVGLR